jgi:hypothetical protein
MPAYGDRVVSPGIEPVELDALLLVLKRIADDGVVLYRLAGVRSELRPIP